MQMSGGIYQMEMRGPLGQNESGGARLSETCFHESTALRNRFLRTSPLVDHLWCETKSFLTGT